jgi:hypothetical protein
MLGDGIRLFECPGIEPVRWERIHDGTRRWRSIYPARPPIVRPVPRRRAAAIPAATGGSLSAA